MSACDQRRSRARILDLAKRRDRVQPDVSLRIFERFHQPGNGARAAQLRKGHRCLPADAGVRILQRADQRVDGGFVWTLLRGDAGRPDLRHRVARRPFERRVDDHEADAEADGTRSAERSEEDG